jgi:hypothetical protein
MGGLAIGVRIAFDAGLLWATNGCCRCCGAVGVAEAGDALIRLRITEVPSADAAAIAVTRALDADLAHAVARGFARDTLAVVILFALHAGVGVTNGFARNFRAILVFVAFDTRLRGSLAGMPAVDSLAVIASQAANTGARLGVACGIRGFAVRAAGAAYTGIGSAARGGRSRAITVLGARNTFIGAGVAGAIRIGAMSVLSTPNAQMLVRVTRRCRARAVLVFETRDAGVP